MVVSKKTHPKHDLTQFFFIVFIGYQQDLKGEAYCLPCMPGTYNNKVGMPVCEKCGVGQYRTSDMDAATCQQCKLGETTTMEGVATCSGCNLGEYGSSKGYCSSCPAGRYQDGKGETRCKSCKLFFLCCLNV